MVESLWVLLLCSGAVRRSLHERVLRAFPYASLADWR